MDLLSTAHLVLLLVWAAVLVFEFVIEASGLEPKKLALTAKMHFWADLLIEVPVVLGVLVTGALLTVRAWPPSPMLQGKIAASLVAIGFNLFCVVQVIQRHRHIRDSKLRARYQKRVWLSVIGLPFGALAAYLGFAY